MNERLTSLLNATAAMTLFLPVDEAWNALHPIERLYLESGFAHDDLLRILEFHAVAEERVHYADKFKDGHKREPCPTLL
jgi:solute carrier family 25 carnitine/acylcarnitine transporter 20/29